MYAIVKNGSKQYKAEVGSTIKFEKLAGNAGDKVEFDVLMLSDDKGIKVGKDVEGVKAFGEIVNQGKDKKVVVFKYKAKKNERKKQGHRQPFTNVKITAIGKEEVKKSADDTAKTDAPKAKTTSTKSATTKTATKSSSAKTTKTTSTAKTTKAE